MRNPGRCAEWLALVLAILWINRVDAQELWIRADGQRPERQLYGQQWASFDDGVAHASGSRNLSTGNFNTSTSRVLTERVGPRARIVTRCRSSIEDVKDGATIPVANKLVRIKTGGREGISLAVVTGEEADQRKDEVADGLVAYLGGIFQVESSADADKYHLKVERIQAQDGQPTFSGSLRTSQKETGFVEGVEAITDGRAGNVLQFGIMKFKVVAVIPPGDDCVGWVALTKIREASK